MFIEPSKCHQAESTSISKTEDQIQQPVYQGKTEVPKITTPADRIRIITDRTATTAPPKRPFEIIENPEMDPTIRKKRRTEHPLNVILGRRLEQICDAKNKIPPLSVDLSDSDSEDEQVNSTIEPIPKASTSTASVSTDLNLSSSSDSSMEEGEISELSNNNNNCTDNSALTNKNETMNNSDVDSDSSSSRDSAPSRTKIVPDHTTVTVKPRNVNFDLSANTICEYTPECSKKKDHPVYVPTPIVRHSLSSGSVQERIFSLICGK